MNRRIVRINPLREVVEVQRALDRFFDEAWQAADTSDPEAYALPLDVIERDNAYWVRASLPGSSEDHINISLDGDVLEISAEIPDAVVEEGETRTLLQERRTGRFSRRLTLNKGVDAENVDASYDNGVLTLHLPFVPEVQPRQISIKRSK